MRKKYVSPDMRVTVFDTADVLTTSGDTVLPEDGFDSEDN